MRAIVEFLGNIFGGKKIKVVRIEGKETKEAKGRTQRLAEARAAKEALRRTGNKNIQGD